MLLRPSKGIRKFVFRQKSFVEIVKKIAPAKIIPDAAGKEQFKILSAKELRFGFVPNAKTCVSSEQME
jgi:hypothetical protein